MCLVVVAYPDSNTAMNALFFFWEPVDTTIDKKEIKSSLTQVDTYPALAHPDHPTSQLSIRFARSTDRKIKGARERSRYYLFNPPPSELREINDRDQRFYSRQYTSQRRFQPYARIDARSRRTASNRNKELFPDTIDSADLSLPPQVILPARNRDKELFPSKLNDAHVNPESTIKFSDKSNGNAHVQNSVFDRLNPDSDATEASNGEQKSLLDRITSGNSKNNSRRRAKADEYF